MPSPAGSTGELDTEHPDWRIRAGSNVGQYQIKKKHRKPSFWSPFQSAYLTICKITLTLTNPHFNKTCLSSALTTNFQLAGWGSQRVSAISALLLFSRGSQHNKFAVMLGLIFTLFNVSTIIPNLRSQQLQKTVTTKTDCNITTL